MEANVDAERLFVPVAFQSNANSSFLLAAAPSQVGPGFWVTVRVRVRIMDT